MRPADPEHQKRHIEKILRNARRLFAQHAYDRVSLDRIAAACRLTKPVLYCYFKDSLILCHRFVGCLVHSSLLSQLFKPGRLYLPGQRAYVELLVDHFIKATSAPPLPFRR